MLMSQYGYTSLSSFSKAYIACVLIWLFIFSTFLCGACTGWPVEAYALIGREDMAATMAAAADAHATTGCATAAASTATGNSPTATTTASSSSSRKRCQLLLPYTRRLKAAVAAHGTDSSSSSIRGGSAAGGQSGGSSTGLSAATAAGVPATAGGGSSSGLGAGQVVRGIEGPEDIHAAGGGGQQQQQGGQVREEGVVDGMEGVGEGPAALRFSRDGRVAEVRQLLSSAAPVQLKVGIQQNSS